MDIRIRDNIFLLSSVSFIFINIPKQIELNFLLGPMSGKLAVYFLLLGFFAWGIKNRDKLFRKSLYPRIQTYL